MTTLDLGYIVTALTVAVTITFSLRAIPFGVKTALRRSALLADIGRWMPLGAISILAVYALTTIDTASPTHGVPELCGVGVTVPIHLWRHNLVLSLVAGTAACLVMYEALPIA